MYNPSNVYTERYVVNARVRVFLLDGVIWTMIYQRGVCSNNAEGVDLVWQGNELN